MTIVNSTPIKKPDPAKKPDFERSLIRLEEIVKKLLPRRFKRFLLIHFFKVSTTIATPARYWLETEVLPKLPGLGFRRILFVGTAPYTSTYEAIVTRRGGEWITCDFNPSAAVWNMPVMMEM